ncbi:VOC family protein [Mycobacterium sp. NPDC003449]
MQPEGAVMQIAHVVGDLDAAIAEFGMSWGAGPFYAGVIRVESGHFYRGTESPLAIDVGMALSGGVLVELIQPLDGDRSVFSEALDARGPGFHHIVRRESFDVGVARCERAGYPRALEMTTAAGERTVVYDTTRSNGGFLEVVDLNVTFEPLMGRLAEAHARWDGHIEPRRSLASLFGDSIGG